MLKNVPSQWKAEIIDAVGINEFTDMFIQSIRVFIREDLSELPIEQKDFDKELTDELLDSMISKIMHLVYEKGDDISLQPLSTRVIIARAILNDIDINHIDFNVAINHEALLEQINHNKTERFQMAINFRNKFISNENIIIMTSKELGITYKEIGEATGYSEEEIKMFSVSENISRPLQKALELYRETFALRQKLKKNESVKQTLRDWVSD